MAEAVHAVHTGGTVDDVPDRIRRMVAWLAAHSDRIARSDRLQVTFNCAGPKIQVDVKEGSEA